MINSVVILCGEHSDYRTLYTRRIWLLKPNSLFTVYQNILSSFGILSIVFWFFFHTVEAWRGCQLTCEYIIKSAQIYYCVSSATSISIINSLPVRIPKVHLANSAYEKVQTLNASFYTEQMMALKGAKLTTEIPAQENEFWSELHNVRKNGFWWSPQVVYCIITMVLLWNYCSLLRWLLLFHSSYIRLKISFVLTAIVCKCIS